MWYIPVLTNVYINSHVKVTKKNENQKSPENVLTLSSLHAIAGGGGICSRVRIPRINPQTAITGESSRLKCCSFID